MINTCAFPTQHYIYHIICILLFKSNFIPVKSTAWLRVIEIRTNYIKFKWNEIFQTIYFADSVFCIHSTAWPLGFNPHFTACAPSGDEVDHIHVTSRRTFRTLQIQHTRTFLSLLATHRRNTKHWGQSNSRAYVHQHRHWVHYPSDEKIKTVWATMCREIEDYFRPTIWLLLARKFLLTFETFVF